jgi:ADP-heptose:LPS heptosyltransferase
MLSAPSLVPDVKKIAVLRANAVGDFIVTLPALEALRAAYPHAEVTLLGRQWHADFLADRPSPIDRVIVTPPSEGVNASAERPEEPAELEAFFARMRRERFDLALQLHGGGRYSNPFVRRLGARITAGLRTPDAEPLERWIPYIYFQSEVARFLEAVALVGAHPVTLEPRVHVTEHDRSDAWRVVPAGDRPMALLHPGAGDPRRWWPVENFAAVGDALAQAGAQVLINGTEAERPRVDAIRKRMSSPAIDLCARLSLGGLAGLLARCAVVVSNDSGPMHLAHAVGAPVVGIYWCFNLLTAGPLTRARHRPLTSWRMDCPTCGRNCLDGRCEHQDSFVADVPVKDVLAAAFELLSPACAPSRSLAS